MLFLETGRMIGIIEIEGMEFFAYHGCFEAERVVGNKFTVNACLHYECSRPAESDRIEDALNYQTTYEIIAREMMQPSHLLEHVGKRILSALYAAFPQLQYARIKISKMNPPLGAPASPWKNNCPIILEVNKNLLSLHRKTQQGRLAEGLGNGLQNRLKQFDSATDLPKKISH